MGVKWKEPEKQLLWQKLVQEGLPLGDIAIPGRKSDRIRRQALKMGLIEKLRHPPPTRKQKAKLRKFRKLEFSTRQISDLDMLGLPHRTTTAIQKYLADLRLVNKNRSRAAKNKKVWRDGEKQEFDDFLRQKSAELAPEQIAKTFGVKTATVNGRKKFLGIESSFAKTLAIPYVREKIRQSNQKRGKRILLAFEKRVAKWEKKLLLFAEKLRTRKRILEPEERLCRKCGRNWPKHPKFFHHSIARTNFCSSWHFSRICVICVARQRHQKRLAEHQRKCSRSLE